MFAGDGHKRWQRVRMAWICLIGAALLIVGMVAWQVDDWRRDLTNNQAATSPDARDEALRPIVTGLALAELVETVKQAAAALDRWQLVDEAWSQGAARLYFVRTTPLFRFKDDVTVDVRGAGDGATVEAQSRSRVGKGDLGQNPRNLKELLGAVRARLAEGGPAGGRA